MILLIGATLVGQSSCSTSVEARRSSQTKQKKSSSGPTDIYNKVTTDVPLTEISASSVVQINYSTDPGISGAVVQVQAEEKFRDYIEMKVERGRLEIYLDSSNGILNNLNAYDPMVRVWVKNGGELKRVTLDGACSFNVTDNYTSSQNLQITGSGACSFYFNEIKLTGNSQLMFDLSGACTVSVPGFNGPSLRMAASGACSVKFDQVVAPKATIVSSGACDVRMKDLNCQSLTAQADGVAKMWLSGVSNAATLTSTGLANLDAARFKATSLSLNRSGEAKLDYDGDVKMYSPAGSSNSVIIYTPDKEEEEIQQP